MTGMVKITQSNRRGAGKAFAATAAAMAAAVVFAGCSSGSDSSDTKADGAGSSSNLVIGSDLTYPPYTYLSNDKPAGFDIDIVTALAKEMDVKPTFKDTRFEQLIPSINSGQIQLIASALYITAERAQQVDYIPYFSTGNSIIVKDGSKSYADAASLCGVSVGVIKGAAAAQSMRGESSDKCKADGKKAIDVREFNTDPEATQAVLSGAVKAEVTDAAVAGSLVKKMDGRVKITSSALLYPVPVGLAVKKGNADLKKKVEDALAALQKNGAYDKLLKEYNLEPVNQDQVDAILK